MSGLREALERLAAWVDDRATTPRDPDPHAECPFCMGELQREAIMEHRSARVALAAEERRARVPNLRCSSRGLPRIVCLCGSTRFKNEFIAANFRETMAGRIVLTVGWFGHADGAIYSPTPEEKAALDELHKRKIDLADEVLVIDVDGYIGDSTSSEIAYARDHGKRVRYLSRESAAPPASEGEPGDGEGARGDHKVLLRAVEAWADERGIDSQVFDRVFTAASMALGRPSAPAAPLELREAGDGLAVVVRLYRDYGPSSELHVKADKARDAWRRVRHAPDCPHWSGATAWPCRCPAAAPPELREALSAVDCIIGAVGAALHQGRGYRPTLERIAGDLGSLRAALAAPPPEPEAGGTEEWVPVSERLPEPGVPVLGYWKRPSGEGAIVVMRENPPGGWFWNVSIPLPGIQSIGNVTHWRPLPAPPEGE